MKEFIKDTFGTTLGLLGFLVFMQYYNDGYISLKKMLFNSRNWIIVLVVVAISFGIKLYRRRNKAIPKDF